MTSWHEDYYLGSSDYPLSGGDDDLDPEEAWDDPEAVREEEL